MADEKEQNASEEQESQEDATEFLADESEPVVPVEPKKEDEVGPDLPEKPVEAKSKDEVSEKLKEEPRKIGAPISKGFDKLKTFYIECKRVLRVTRKPDKEEFKTIVKISAIGMAIIGAVGFLVFFLKELLFKF